ncbi:hypothetical protein TURU_068593 [Turdus rufiventris]|nr:hypothetical protein TURU_068593 [Turdus rufiventris]
MRAGEWTFAEADNYLQTKYGPSAALSEEEKIQFDGNQGSEKEAGDGLISSLFKAFQNPERKKNEETLPPRDPSYDNRRRWKGLIENATVSRDFTLEPVAMPVLHDAQGDRWEALDWKTITNLQKTVMQYGIENKLVRNQVIKGVGFQPSGFDHTLRTRLRYKKKQPMNDNLFDYLLSVRQLLSELDEEARQPEVYR